MQRAAARGCCKGLLQGAAAGRRRHGRAAAAAASWETTQGCHCCVYTHMCCRAAQSGAQPPPSCCAVPAGCPCPWRTRPAPRTWRCPGSICVSVELLSARRSRLPAARREGRAALGVVDGERQALADVLQDLRARCCIYHVCITVVSRVAVLGSLPLHARSVDCESRMLLCSGEQRGNGVLTGRWRLVCTNKSQRVRSRAFVCRSRRTGALTRRRSVFEKTLRAPPLASANARAVQ